MRPKSRTLEPTCPIPDKGFWFPPTVFTNVTQAHRIAREEIFGPVLSVLTFRTPEEAVAKANNTPFGLSAGIWTEKAAAFCGWRTRCAQGIVWANTFNRFDPRAPLEALRNRASVERVECKVWVRTSTWRIRHEQS